MRWLWSEDKNRANKRLHGLSFETAKLAFNDPMSLSRVDPHNDGDRWQTVGVVGTIALFVVHTWPEHDVETGETVGRIISARKRRSMNERRMKKVTSRLSPAQRSELAVLSRLPDENINTDDIPEQRDWREAERGVFFNPAPKDLAVRLDADVVAWFKTHETDTEGSQARINSILKAFVARHDDKP